MAFYFKNTKTDIIMTKENEEDFKNNNICRFCEKYILSDKVRDHCHLTGKYRGPAHNTCNINVKQKDTNFIPFAFHNFSFYLIVFLKQNLFKNIFCKQSQSHSLK